MTNEDASADTEAFPSGPVENLKPSLPKRARKWTFHPLAINPLALAVIILGSIAVGAFAVNLAGPNDSTVAADGTHVLTGTDRLAAAEQWLQRPATAEDAFPGTDLTLQPSSTRRIAGDQTYLKVWIGKTTKNELCLLGIQDSSGVSYAKCATPKDFSVGGLTLLLGSYQISWDGNSVTTTSTFDPSKN